MRSVLPSIFLILAIGACSKTIGDSLNRSIGHLDSRPTLKVAPGSAAQSVTISGEYTHWSSAAQVFTLQSSDDLRNWTTRSILLHAPFTLSESLIGKPRRYYRLAARDKTDTDDFANHVLRNQSLIFKPADCGATIPISWAKFSIDLADPDRIYFQDSSKYLLHYEFAVNRLERFKGMSPQSFINASMRLTNQQIVLGTVLTTQLQSSGNLETAIQFIGYDPIPPERIVALFKQVRDSVDFSSPFGNIANPKTVYLPTFEQAEIARQNEAFFASHGIEIGSLEEWNPNSTGVYSPGWAVGRLKYLPATEVPRAYADGRLGPLDVLLTDSVPSELPFLSGIITLTPTTPNSHVVILAESYGVPLIHISDPAEALELKAMNGHDVMVRTGTRLTDRRPLIVDLENLETGLKSQILALKEVPQLAITPKGRLRRFYLPAEGLNRSDIRYVGGKAANFGLLRRVIPDNSPHAIAFTFDLWDAFLSQQLAEGITLQESIRRRISGYTYPADVGALRADLAQIRQLITQTARFTPEQQTQILAALQGFDRNRNIRFRSSTNVEDTEQFTGAGLYDSFSGCAADDLDGDSAGPSICDAGENNERGVFRAMQKVYASFYNENAFLERLRHRVPEDQVGMALLVHHSTPDQFEMANGVAVVRHHTNQPTVLVGELVTQAGAVSVTNPDSAARPEFVQFYSSPNVGTIPTFKEFSSLVPLGMDVLTPRQDYTNLIGLISKASFAYIGGKPSQAATKLEFEFKKVEPGFLQIKQIREVPMRLSPGETSTFLLSRPQKFLPFGDPWATHRLKSRFHMESFYSGTSPEQLADPLYRNAEVAFVSGGQLQRLSGPPLSWTGSAQSAGPAGATQIAVTNTWRSLHPGETNEFNLITSIPRVVSGEWSPMITLADATLQFQVNFGKPIPVPDSNGSTRMTNSQQLALRQVDWSSTNRSSFSLKPQIGSFDLDGEYQTIALHSVDDRFDASCGQPARNESFAYAMLSGVTRIRGLVDRELVLASELSQTYLRTGRESHETIQDIILDPWSEPGLPEEIKKALTNANIWMIHFHSFEFGREETEWRILGLDGIFRQHL